MYRLKWEPTITHLKDFAKMCCTICEEYRKPTEEEILKILKA